MVLVVKNVTRKNTVMEACITCINPFVTVYIPLERNLAI
jgi:hypothetical protein